MKSCVLSRPLKPAISRLSMLLSALLLAACASQQEPGNTMAAAETVCVEPRPEACTMDYRPVCARLESGERRTYPNACGACADPEVVASVPGACE